LVTLLFGSSKRRPALIVSRTELKEGASSEYNFVRVWLPGRWRRVIHGIYVQATGTGLDQLLWPSQTHLLSSNFLIDTMPMDPIRIGATSSMELNNLAVRERRSIKWVRKRSAPVSEIPL
jgi:hypothetical protein